MEREKEKKFAKEKKKNNIFPFDKYRRNDIHLN